MTAALDTAAAILQVFKEPICASSLPNHGSTATSKKGTVCVPSWTIRPELRTVPPERGTVRSESGISPLERQRLPLPAAAAPPSGGTVPLFGGTVRGFGGRPPGTGGTAALIGGRLSPDAQASSPFRGNRPEPRGDRPSRIFRTARRLQTVRRGLTAPSIHGIICELILRCKRIVRAVGGSFFEIRCARQERDAPFAGRGRPPSSVIRAVRADA